MRTYQRALVARRRGRRRRTAAIVAGRRAGGRATSSIAPLEARRARPSSWRSVTRSDDSVAHRQAGDERARRAGEVGVEPAQPGGGEAPRVAARRARRPRRPSPPPPSGSSSSWSIARRVAAGLATLDEQAGHAVVDDVEQPADRAGDDRHAARRGLEGDQPEALAAARHDDDVGGAVVAGRGCGAAAARRTATRSATPELDGQLAGLGPPRRRRRRRWPRRRSPAAASGRRAERGERTDGDVGRLQRLDPPDEQHHRHVGRQPDRPARAGAVARREEGVLDGRRHDLDAPGRVAVEAPELAAPPRGQLTQIASLQPITSASARSRHAGSRSPPSALTRASVWKVDTSGTPRRA